MSDGSSSQTHGALHDDDALIKSDVMYKTTRSCSKTVIRRRIILFPGGKFSTFHESEEKGLHNENSWLLDKRCVLLPRKTEDIKSVTKTERLQEKWKLSQWISGEGREITLVRSFIHTPMRRLPCGLLF